MTNEETPRRDVVWTFDSHPGFLRAIGDAGAVAAPLLAGFSFTLLALVVSSMAPDNVTVISGQSRTVIATTQVSIAPAIAAALFLAAGLAMIASVQFAIAMRYHALSPSELAELYPEYFRPSGRLLTRNTASRLPGWRSDALDPIQVGNLSVGAFPRELYFRETKLAEREAQRARHSYHAGIVFLLGGLACFVTPASGSWTTGRSILFGVAVLGLLAEIVWIAVLEAKEIRTQNAAAE